MHKNAAEPSEGQEVTGGEPQPDTDRSEQDARSMLLPGGAIENAAHASIITNPNPESSWSPFLGTYDTVVYRYKTEARRNKRQARERGTEGATGIGESVVLGIIA